MTSNSCPKSARNSCASSWMNSKGKLGCGLDVDADDLEARAVIAHGRAAGAAEQVEQAHYSTSTRAPSSAPAISVASERRWSSASPRRVRAIGVSA